MIWRTGTPISISLFLRNKGTSMGQWQPGATAEEIRLEARFWGLAIMAGTVVERGGRVHVPETYNVQFLADLEGDGFDGLVADIRSVALVPDPVVEPDELASAPVDPQAVVIAVATLAVGAVALLLVALWGRRRRTGV